MTLNPVYAALQIGLVTARFENHPNIHAEIYGLTGYNDSYCNNYDRYIRDGIYAIRYELQSGNKAAAIFKAVMTQDAGSVIHQKFTKAQNKHLQHLDTLISAAERSSNFKTMLLFDHAEMVTAYHETAASMHDFARNLDSSDYNFFMDIAEQTDDILQQRKKKLTYRIGSAPKQKLLPSGSE